MATIALVIGPAARPDSEYVDHLLLRSPIEEDAPLSDAESPEALRAAEALDVAVGKPADAALMRSRSFRPTLRRLESSGADLDPPSA
jgi:hypothetical protein